MDSIGKISPLKGGWLLLRSIAVISSSVAAIISSMLPLFLYYPISAKELIPLFFLLLFSAFLIHGVLTHILNDYVDHLSGTDIHSPAILSGGSRVIQKGFITIEKMRLVGIWLMITLVFVLLIFILFDFYRLAVLLAVGLWGAVTYSLPPLRLSYRPFTGEWLCTFPSVLFLGLAGAWLTLDNIPDWAFQNAVINALICISWVMVHHIPDIRADKNATPMKQTSVVWCEQKFGSSFIRFPALMYYIFAALCGFWLGLDRLPAALGLLLILCVSVIIIGKMDINDFKQVSAYEKILLLLAMTAAVWLGLFI
ncbi:prenyltransferase [Alteribacillus sp. YIM 98480]|uniref:prenyltransferase n=1 Tax=Alteribacillus sp. YIM 98480 TaxID=2606599 RepID=UPI001E619F90|nr:prenyltransferase [Alteribacillus sp. YIM 98480]